MLTGPSYHRIDPIRMTHRDPLDTSTDTPDRLPRRTLGAAEWRLLLIAAGIVLAAYAFVSQLPRWLGW